MSQPALNPETYRWAEPADECAAQMFKARDKYRDALKSGDMYPRWVRASRCYHALADGSSGDGSFLGRRGSKGQRAVTRNSRTATDARHAISIISQAVPAIDGLPVNSAPESLGQVRLVKRLFEYYMERRQLGREFYKGAVGSFKFGTFWLFFDWDPFAGLPLETPEPIGAAPEQGLPDERPLRQTTGDVIYRSRSPLDCVIDLHQTGLHDWMMVSDPVNRWELIARYPMHEEEIKKLPSVAQDDENKWGADFRVMGSDRAAESDLVRVLTLYHRKCRAVPQGRMLAAVSKECWLFEGPLPYEEIPSVELVAGDRIDGTPWSDSPMFHATGTQAAIDRALSAWITNILATGHQLISITDPNFEIAEISDGVSAVVNKPGPGGGEPKGISLSAPQVENERLVETLKHDVDGTFATNSVIRGEPDANIRSGAFAGLMVQQAITFLNPAQYSFQRGIEQGGNHLLAILKRFADKPLIAELAGPGGEWRQQAFSQKDISGIHRIYAKPGNPAQQTMAYRKSMADFLLERNLIKTVQEYMTMVSTGEPGIAEEDAETEVINILRENEVMLKSAQNPSGLMQPPIAGVPAQPAPPVMVIITDNDALHIRKHAAVLDEPTARTNPVLVKIVTDHILAHYQQALTKPPPLAMMLGQASAAPPPMAPAGPSGPPAPAHPAAKPGSKTGPEHAPPPTSGP